MKSIFTRFGIALTLLMYTFAANASTVTSYTGYYQASYTSDCTPASVDFTILTTPVGTLTKTINFGDGGPDVAWTGPTINHVYSVANTYDAYVQFYGSGGSYLGYDYIRIEIYGQPGNVENVYSSIDACPGDMVRMRVSQGWNASPDFTYSWNWGDGSPVEVTYQNDLQHVYASPGIYNITVTTTGGPCPGTYISNGSINIHTAGLIPAYVEYNIYLSENKACPNTDIYFGYPDEFASAFVQWGDGTYSSSNEHIHAYTALGTYYPKVTITNGCGDSKTFTDTLEIVDNLSWGSGTYASIGYEPTICPGTEVHFSAWVGATALAWYSEDGTLLSTQSYFEHEFTESDSVYLVATNGCGFDTVYQVPVEVVSTIPIDPNLFEPYISDSVCTGAEFVYRSDDNDPKDFMTWEWDFGDGTVLTDYSGTYSYATAGTYTVTVTTTNTCGQDSSTTFNVYVGPGVGPDPNSIMYFMAGEDAVTCPNDSALFVGLYYTNDGTYSMDFGDGNVSSTPSTLTIFGQTYFFWTHPYASIGTYTTELTYTNGCGLSITKNLVVNVGSNAPISANAFYDEAANICLGDPINFYGYGGNQFVWDFGDGSGTLITNSVMDQIPHVYENPGSYIVTVQVTNNCGNSDFTEMNITIPDNKIYITTNTVDAQCLEADGKAIAVITGGNPPYDVTWSNGSNEILVDSLTSGIYVCNVTDQNGCYNFGIATVSDAQAPAIVVNNVIDVTCNGGNDGVIDINVIGSSGPYTYSWNNGSATQDQAGLVAGPYEIYVTDAYGCISTASINVNEPDPVNVSFLVNDASCGGGNDGGIIANANGSSGPYTYVWSTGDVGSTLTDLDLGVYEVNVIDTKGCIVTQSITVDEDNGNGGPAIALNSISDFDCGGAGSTIDISVFAGTGAIIYAWSNGATTQDISVTSGGLYTVTVTDAMGCKAIEQFPVSHTPPPGLNICMVTVDSMYAANKVIWEKPVATNIDHFNIYRESSMAGLYYHVGEVPYDSLSVFTDYVANPQIQSWRYKLSVVDNCDEESVLSEEHKTIHLNQNLGLGGTVNLIWDDYEGFSYSTFNIVRYTQSSGYVNLASVSALNHSYTDAAAPTSDSTLFYIITLDLLDPCVATRAQNNNTVRSNRTDNSLAPPNFTIDNVGETVAGIPYSHVYPNPSNGLVTVEFEVSNSGTYTIQVVDALGNQVLAENCGKIDLFCKKQLNFTGFERGVYFVNIISENGRISKRIVKI